MALTENTIIDKVEIVDCGGWRVIQVRSARIILDNGVEISRRFSQRRCIHPCDDYSNESENVKSVCDIYHTQACKDAFIAAQSL